MERGREGVGGEGKGLERWEGTKEEVEEEGEHDPTECYDSAGVQLKVSCN